MDYKLKLEQMIQQQLCKRGINDTQVIEAIRSTPRHDFVDPKLIKRAYDDNPLSIGQGQTISQPYIVAYMTQKLCLKPTDKVLEIGTGCGYQTAILSKMVSKVYTMELTKELHQRASNLLSDLGYTNIIFTHGNGYSGWPEHAPFDAIIVTAAPEQVPHKLLQQLSSKNGRMIVPVGPRSSYQQMQLIYRNGEDYSKIDLIPVAFVPMRYD